MTCKKCDECKRPNPFCHLSSGEIGANAGNLLKNQMDCDDLTGWNPFPWIPDGKLTFDICQYMKFTKELDECSTPKTSK